MNRLALLILVFIGAFSCRPDNQLTGDWTAIYVGRGDDVRESSVGVPFSNLYEPNLSFQTHSDLSLFNNKIEKRCKYNIDGSRLVLTNCVIFQNEDREGISVYHYEQSNDTLSLFSEDFKWVIQFRRTKILN
jgi:hypothetical protein